MTSTLAAADIATGVPATIAYFVLALAILGVGFLIQDALTPGAFREQVFVDHLPNAGVLLGSQTIALGIILSTAIATSYDDLGRGLLHVAVYGFLGLVLQTVVLLIMEALVPGRFRDLVDDPKIRSSALVTGLVLIVVGVINAVCLT